MKQKNSIEKKVLSLAILTASFLVSHTGYAATAALTPEQVNSSLKSNPLVSDIQMLVNILSAGVGIVVVAMLIVGGIQYSIAGDNPTALTAAKKRITNALIALAAFAFSFAFLQWLIPGGVFG